MTRRRLARVDLTAEQRRSLDAATRNLTRHLNGVAAVLGQWGGRLVEQIKPGLITLQSILIACVRQHRRAVRRARVSRRWSHPDLRWEMWHRKSWQIPP